MPRLLRSVGLGPVFFPAQRCFGQRPIHRLIRPFDPIEVVVLLQPQRPELLEHAGLGPLLEAAMRGTAGTDAGGPQRVPLTAGTQHVKDGVHGTAVLYARAMAAKRMRWRRRQQWFNPYPHRVWHAPVADFFDAAGSIRRVHLHSSPILISPPV